jgi:hypothetical protein
MRKKIDTFYLLSLIIIIILITINFIFSYLIKNGIYSKNVYTKNKSPQMSILIEVDKKQLKLINRENEKIIDTYIIATGKPGSPTPLGSFKIVEKGHWGEGFGSRWIGLNVPWGKYGIHGTNKPNSIGSNVSAGCIRMNNRDVEELYSKVSNNTIVLITNGLYGPFGEGFRELKPGDRGADVLEVQKRLKYKGYYEGTSDGIYGETMKIALINYLKDNDIPLTDRVTSEIYARLGIILME